MIAQKHQNQEHPPLPKKKRVDSVGNNRKRIFYKKNDASILFARSVPENACVFFIENIRDMAKKLGINIEGNFIITQGK